MSLERTGLPPRGSRTKKSTGTISLKKWIQSGLILFGALFFGLIGVELYQAKTGQPTDAGAPVVNADVTTPAQTASPAAEGQAAPASASAAPQEPAAAAASETGAVVPAASAASATQTATDATKGQAQAAPASATKAPSATQGKTNTAADKKPKAIRHVVQKGETLYMLSRKYYGNNSNVARIAKYNGLSAEAQLTAGTVVLVPLLQ